jgi:hypothetical protein
LNNIATEGERNQTSSLKANDMPSITSSERNLAGREEVCSATLNEFVNVIFGFNGSRKISIPANITRRTSEYANLLKDVPFNEG